MLSEVFWVAFVTTISGMIIKFVSQNNQGSPNGKTPSLLNNKL